MTFVTDIQYFSLRKSTNSSIIGYDVISNNRSLNDNHNLFVDPPKNYLALFLLIIPFLTVVGNALVIASVVKNRSLHNATNYLIVNLAVADFFVALCVMPFAVYVEVENSIWKLPKRLCDIYIATDVCASTASILNLVAISWDRYIAIKRPILYARKAKKLKSVAVVIVAVWSISLSIAVPLMAGLNKLEDTEHCEFTNAVYIVASSVGSFFVPCLMIIILYGVVLKTLQDRQKVRKVQLKKRTSSNAEHSIQIKTSADEEIRITSTVSDDKETIAGDDKYLAIINDDNEILRISTENETDEHFQEHTMTCTITDQSVEQKDSCSVDWWLKNLSNDNSTVPFVDELNSPSFDEFDCMLAPTHKSFSAPIAHVESVENFYIWSTSSSKRKPKDAAILCETAEQAQLLIEDKKSSGQMVNCGNNENHHQRAKLHCSVSFNQTSPPKTANGKRQSQKTSRATLHNKTNSQKRPASSVLVKMTKKQRLKESRHFHKEKRATHTLAVVLVVFLLCWVPFFTCHITNSICMLKFDNACVPFLAFFLTSWLGYMNSFMNPVIYTVFNAEYRKAFANLLMPSKNSRNQRSGAFV